MKKKILALFLGLVMLLSVMPITPIASAASVIVYVGDGGDYTSLKTAVYEGIGNNNGTVVLCSDVEVDESITFYPGYTITITSKDDENYELSAAENCSINYGGTLIIDGITVDCSEELFAPTSSDSVLTIRNSDVYNNISCSYGTINIENGATNYFYGTIKQSISSYHTTVNISEGKFYGTIKTDYVNISGGYFAGTISNINGLSITGGEFDVSISNWQNYKTRISDGYMSTKETSAYEIGSVYKVFKAAVTLTGDGTTKGYSSFLEALEAANEKTTYQKITLLDNVSIDGSYSVNYKRIIEIDLNGHTLIDSVSPSIDVYGILIISDSSGNGKIAFGLESENVVKASYGGRIYVLSGKVCGPLICDENSEIVLKGGSFNCDPSEFVDTNNGYSATCSNNLWSVKFTGTQVAKVIRNSTDPEVCDIICTSLENAIEKAKDGNTVKLIGNETINSTIEISKNITLDLGKSTLTAGENLEGAMFDISGNVTITGNVNAAGTNSMAMSYDNVNVGNHSVINAKEGSEVLVKGGLYVLGNEAFCTGDGTVSVTGGWFNKSSVNALADGYGVAYCKHSYDITKYNSCSYAVTNQKATITFDANGGEGGPGNKEIYYVPNFTTETSIRELLGFGYNEPSWGSDFIFKGWAFTNDASSDDALAAGDNFDVAGDTTIYAIWEVPAESDYVAQVGENKYLTIKEAFEAANDGDTITLLKSATYTTETLTIAEGEEITIDLNNRNLNVAIANSGTLVVKGTGKFLQKPSGDGEFITVGGTYNFDPTDYAGICKIEKSGTLYTVTWPTIKVGDVTIEYGCEGFDFRTGEFELKNYATDADFYADCDLTLILSEQENGYNLGNVKVDGNLTLVLGEQENGYNLGNIEVDGDLIIDGQGKIDGYENYKSELNANSIKALGNLTIGDVSVSIGAGDNGIIVGDETSDSDVLFLIDNSYVAFDEDNDSSSTAIQVTGLGTTRYVQRNSEVYAYGGIYIGDSSKTAHTSAVIGGGGLSLYGNFTVYSKSNDSTVTMSNCEANIDTSKTGLDYAFLTDALYIKSGEFGFTFGEEPVSGICLGDCEITGGTFNYNVKEFVPSGYEVTSEEYNNITWYTVSKVQYIVSTQAALDDEIVLRFKIKYPDIFTNLTDFNNANYNIKFSRLDINGNTQDESSLKGIDFKGATLTEDGIYTYEYRVAAKNIGDKIRVDLYHGDYQVVDSAEISVADYLHALQYDSSQSDKTKNLATALLNYGYAAQEYFGYDGALTKEDKGDIENLSIESNYGFKNYGKQTFTDTYSQESVDVTVKSASLILKEKITLRIYVDIPSNYPLYYKIGDGETIKLSCSDEKKNGLYYYDISGIGPQDLDTTYTIMLYGGTKLLDYAPMTYAYRMFNKADSSQELKNLCLALYGYYYYATEYVTVTE